MREIESILGQTPNKNKLLISQPWVWPPTHLMSADLLCRDFGTFYPVIVLTHRIQKQLTFCLTLCHRFYPLVCPGNRLPWSRMTSLCSTGFTLLKGRFGLCPKLLRQTLSLWNSLFDKCVFVYLGALGYDRVYANNEIYSGDLGSHGYQLDIWRGWRQQWVTQMVNHVYMTEPQ